MKGIRFSFVSQKEFMYVVPDSNILTTEEIINLMKQFNGIATASLPFVQTPRRGTIKDYEYF